MTGAWHTDARFLALAAALLLYGLAGSPTPDNPGLVEFAIALLLLVAIRPSALWRAPLDAGRAWFLPLLCAGFSVPLAIALYQGMPPPAIGRDLAAFIFLCLPLFIFPARRFDELLYVCAALAVMLAVRALAEAFGVFSRPDELQYLANSPLVLMTAIIGWLMAGRDLYDRRIGWRTAFWLAAGILCGGAMILDVQRAFIGAVILSLAGFGVLGAVRAPVRMILPAFAGVIVLLAGWDVAMNTVQGMASKTALVGANLRWQELSAVWEHLDGRWLSILLGMGWGAQFHSPAVGGGSATFTHSLLTYMMFKTGLLGLAATAAALSACLHALWRGAAARPFAAVALFWAMLVPLLLYGSYKSLDFGLVLVLALLLPHGIKRTDPSS